MYKVGKILKIDGNKFGFIEYESGLLTTYSLKDKEKFYFDISSVDFNDLYSNYIDEISKETIDFVSKDVERTDALLKEITPGMIFIGEDDQEYTFLKAEGDKIYFLKDDLGFLDKPDFIIRLTGKFDMSYMNMTNPIKSKYLYDSLTNERKVRRAINYYTWLLMNEPDDSEILEIGNIVTAKTYSQKYNIEYELIGLQVKLKSRVVNKGDANIKVIFLPIYVGIFGDSGPRHLNELFKGSDFNTPQTYVNELGNTLEIMEILVPKKDLQGIEFNFQPKILKT